MNKYFKFAIFTMLALTITIGLVYAQPIPIGQTVQPVPFESNPQAYTETIGSGPTGTTMMYDGDLYTSGNSYLGYGMGSSQYLELNTFTRPSDLGLAEDWDPEWVEIKMKYEVPSAATDDKYQIEYSSDGATWNVLEDNGGLKYGTFSLAIQPWSQAAETSGDGDWTWADIANLKVKITCTKVGLGWDSKKMYIYEVWATVYPAPLPPSSSTTLSVQPPAVTRLRPYDYMLGGAQGLFFVEIYVNDVIDLFSYQFVLYFDTSVLTPYEAFSYYPWTSAAVEDLNDAGGYVALSYYMPPPVPVGQAFTGNSPLCRIYFIVDAYGGGGGGGAYGGLMGTCDLTISKDPLETILGDSEGVQIPSAIYDGWFSGSHYMSFPSGTLPTGDPTGTDWHELYPDYCKNWLLTSFEDTNLDGWLSTSDQIDMTNETGWRYWFHVDEVTVTIWWTLKSPDPALESAAHPMEPYPLEYQEPDVGWFENPIGTYWHVISPPEDFCRWIMITSWEDTDGSTTFTASDQFDFEYLDDPGTHWAHLDSVTTDILVSQKPIDPEPPEFEFPFGVTLLMLLVPIIPLTYLWRLRKKVTKQ